MSRVGACSPPSPSAATVRCATWCCSLRGLTVITGANGSGKSSTYRALRLLADCGRTEGLRAGPQRRAQPALAGQ
ncbi:AAA family ATPase [Mycolicibacterium insubricum]|uniref:AAA family ATPase n=1 Tax=Mycolicibacterium insubricum TaxID=444597 RepID=UPI00390896A9